MRRSLVPLLAILPAAAATLAGAQARDAFPKDAVTYRPSCFESAMEEKAAMAPPPSMAPASAKPAPAPTRQMAPAKAPPGNGPVGQVKTKEAKKAESQAAPAAFDVGGVASGGMTVPVAPMEEAEAAPEPVAAVDDALGARARDEDASPNRPVGRVLDWGAKMFLSNDDSMSLASAQRLLYAVKNNLWFPTSQVRPHELLNYFSFDTVTPDADQTFDVLASAERDGDALAVAFAVKGATPADQPLDLTLVVDRSCSMEAEGRMDYTRRGLRQMTDQLQRGDRLDVVLFDDTKCVPLENYVVGRDDPKLLAETIDRLQPLGGTDLDLGLREGYRVAKAHTETQGRNRRMMLITDAQLNTGDVNPNTVTEIGKAYDADGIRLTGVGVGRDFNDQVLDMLTEKGKGAYVYLGSEAVVDRIFGAGFASLTRTIAHDVQFELQLPNSLAMEKFYGEEISTVAEDVQPIHYYAGTSQVFLQELAIRDGNVVRNDPVVLTIRYRDAITGEPETRTFKTTVGAMLDSDPHNVRKGLALMAWTDLLMEQAMGGEPCGAPLQAYAGRAAKLSDDAEIGYVSGLVKQQCNLTELPAVVPQRAPVAYKVRVDADIPIAEVALACDGNRWTSSLSGSTSVARFDATPGACQLTLSGTVDMTAAVDVPVTGGDVRCVVRGGRLSCG